MSVPRSTEAWYSSSISFQRSGVMLICGTKSLLHYGAPHRAQRGRDLASLPRPPSDPPDLGSRRVHGNPVGRNLAGQGGADFVPVGVEVGNRKRAAVYRPAQRQGDRFDDVGPAVQEPRCGVVTQGKMVQLVRVAPGLNPYPHAEILCRRGTAA